MFSLLSSHGREKGISCPCIQQLQEFSLLICLWLILLFFQFVLLFPLPFCLLLLFLFYIYNDFFQGFLYVLLGSQTDSAGNPSPCNTSCAFFLCSPCNSMALFFIVPPQASSLFNVFAICFMSMLGSIPVITVEILPYLFFTISIFIFCSVFTMPSQTHASLGKPHFGHMSMFFIFSPYLVFYFLVCVH